MTQVADVSGSAAVQAAADGGMSARGGKSWYEAMTLALGEHLNDLAQSVVDQSNAIGEAAAADSTAGADGGGGGVGGGGGGGGSVAEQGDSPQKLALLNATVHQLAFASTMTSSAVNTGGEAQNTLARKG